ncbi:hypothetical protein D3C74_273740 [compost metagenome]
MSQHLNRLRTCRPFAGRIQLEDNRRDVGVGAKVRGERARVTVAFPIGGRIVIIGIRRDECERR